MLEIEVRPANKWKTFFSLSVIISNLIQNNLHESIIFKPPIDSLIKLQYCDCLDSHHVHFKRTFSTISNLFDNLISSIVSYPFSRILRFTLPLLIVRFMFLVYYLKLLARVFFLVYRINFFLIFDYIYPILWVTQY